MSNARSRSHLSSSSLQVSLSEVGFEGDEPKKEEIHDLNRLSPWLAIALDDKAQARAAITL